MENQGLVLLEIVQSGLRDPNIVGLYTDVDGRQMLDRRYTAEAIRKLGLNPRTADLNLIGPECVAVPESMLLRAESTLNQPVATRATVKSELLRLGLPGVNV